MSKALAVSGGKLEGVDRLVNACLVLQQPNGTIVGPLLSGPELDELNSALADAMVTLGIK